MTPDTEEVYDNLPWTGSTWNAMVNNERHLGQLSLQEEITLRDDIGGNQSVQSVNRQGSPNASNSQHSTTSTTSTADSGIGSLRNTPKTSSESDDNGIDQAKLDDMQMDFTKEAMERVDKTLFKRNLSIRPRGRPRRQLQTKRTREDAMKAIGESVSSFLIEPIEF